MPTSTKCRWVIGSWQKMILFLLTCEMNCFIFSLLDICYIKEGLPSDVSTGDQALFTPQESPLFIVRPFQGFWWSLLSNIHSSLSKRRRGTKSPLISPFQELFLPVFAKQSEKLICQKLLFLFNKVDFARKKVPLYPNIRLLERDEWILLDKDP